MCSHVRKFLVLHLLLIIFTSWNLCYIDKARWHINKHRIGNQTSPYFDYACRMHMFVDYLTKYIDPTNNVCYWMWSSLLNLKTWSNLLWMCAFVLFVIWSSPSNTPIKYLCSFKKSIQITPAYHSAHYLVGWPTTLNTPIKEGYANSIEPTLISNPCQISSLKLVWAKWLLVGNWCG